MLYSIYCSFCETISTETTEAIRYHGPLTYNMIWRPCNKGKYEIILKSRDCYGWKQIQIF